MNHRPIAAASLLTLLAALPACLVDDLDTTGLTEAELGELESEIIGGAVEPDYRHPWVVWLSSGCRGVLLDPRWVLTAAHCVTPGLWQGKVSYSRKHPTTGEVRSATRTTNVAPGGGVFLHPQYIGGGGFDTPKNDIALVRLDTPFAIDWDIQTVALPRAPRVIGRTGTIAAANHSDPMMPAGMFAVYRAPMPSTNPSGCLPPAGAFCVGSPTMSLCHGDSGSGFVTIESSRATATGTASYSSNASCQAQTEEEYAGLTDVYAYRSWLLSTMATTDARLLGNTRIRWSGRSANGTMGIGCTNPFGTMWAPLNVLGVQVGSNCAAGETQGVICSVPSGQGLVISGFSLKQTSSAGVVTTSALPFGAGLASYYATLPTGATREFTCSVGLAIAAPPGGGVAGFAP